MPEARRSAGVCAQKRGVWGCTRSIKVQCLRAFSGDAGKQQRRKEQSKQGNPTPLASRSVFLGVNTALIFRLRLLSTLIIFGILYTLGNFSRTLMSVTYLMPHKGLEQFPQSQKTAADGGDTRSTWGPNTSLSCCVHQDGWNCVGKPRPAAHCRAL